MLVIPYVCLCSLVFIYVRSSTSFAPNNSCTYHFTYYSPSLPSLCVCFVLLPKLCRYSSITSLQLTRIRSTSYAGPGHWLQATHIFPSLRFPAPLFVKALRLRIGLPHPCLAKYTACSSGHPLDPPGTNLLRYARGGERASSRDDVRDAVHHIIRESRQHAHRERTSFLP